MRSRRTLLAVLGGIVAFAIVVGAAASLGGLTSTNLGADDNVVASCDTDGITSAYTTLYNTAVTPGAAFAGYKVNDVTIAGVAAACTGQAMSVTLTGPIASKASLAEISGQTVVAGGSNVVGFIAKNILAEDVTGIHVVISGIPVP